MGLSRINIALEGMRFYAFHGVYEEEQKIGRHFIVSVYLECDAHIDGKDELGDTYNYEWIYEATTKEMNVPRKLLETVAYNIGEDLRSRSSLFQSGIIKISKEGLVLGGDVERSVIEYRF